MKVFKIGDKARVRKDLFGGRIYDTCTPYCCYCNETMTNYAGYVVVVSEKDDITGFMKLRKVEDGFTTEMPFSWSDEMLEPIEEEQPTIEEEQQTKKKQPPKQPSKKSKKKSAASTADYSGYTPKSEFYCYDYLNRPSTFSKNAMENITKIEVTVMSGDETGCFYGVYNGKPWQCKFDTMTTSRFKSYDDGSYTVEGRENIEKWINWSYDPEKAIYAEYSMERMRAFKRCYSWMMFKKDSKQSASTCIIKRTENIG